MARQPPRPRGRAVGNEDPDHSPMDGRRKQTDSVRCYDIDALERDRSRSIGPEASRRPPQRERRREHSG